MSLLMCIEYVTENPSVIAYQDCAVYVQVDKEPMADDFGLPFVPLTNKRAKEIFEVFPNMPTFTRHQCRQCLTEVLGWEPSLDMCSGTEEDLLVKVIGKALETKNINNLPSPLAPRRPLPEGTTMNISLIKTASGSVTLLKSYYNVNPMTLGQAKAICTTTPLLLDYSRSTNTDIMRRAIVHMLTSATGHHWSHQVLIPKMRRTGSSDAIDVGRGSKTRNEWEPTPAQLKAGIHYINFKAPLSDGMNEQFLWILLNIRDQDSPIYRWPQHIVAKAAHNRASNKCQVETVRFYPLLIPDLNKELQERIVTKALSYALTHAFVILGMPGKGKTPLAIILSMALSRHIIEKKQLDAEVGVRKCKQFDGLKDTPGEEHIPVIIDDPNLDSMHVEDIKSLLTVDEERIVDCRYHPLKLAAGEPTFLISNTYSEKHEPPAPVYPTITFEEFFKMLGVIFNTSAMTHIMAILKRAVVIIFGKNAVYLRTPGESENVKIEAFSRKGVVDDCLSEDHKPYLTKLKRGQRVKYDDWDKNLVIESKLLDKILADPEELEALLKQETEERWAEEWGEEPDQTSNVASASSTACPNQTGNVNQASPEKKRPRLANQFDDSEAEPEADDVEQ